MKKFLLFVALLGTTVLFNACQKEFSFEIGGISSGSLRADVTGDCLPKSVQGVYEAGAALVADSHYIDVDVDVTAVGAYQVYSDTANGIFFQASGVFSTAGVSTVRLVGNGVPVSAGIHHFKIKYNSSECLVQVTVLPQGGADPAGYTLAGGPNACMDFDLNGNFIKGVPLSDVNKVDIKVNVTRIGTYNITTSAVNGISFTGAGFFTATGDQIITLAATGTPVDIIDTEIKIEAGTSSCSFPVVVIPGAEFSIDCLSAVVYGDYEEGLALDASNTIDISVNVITAGPFSISTAVNGMNFTATGVFAATGPVTVTLKGSGTPAADGSFDLALPGNSPCTVELTVEPGAVASDLQWKFTSGGTTYSGPTEEGIVSSAGGVNSIAISGTTTSEFGAWTVVLTNTSGAISNGTFSGTALSGRFAAFTFSNDVVNWMSFPGTGTALDVIVTNYNTTDKVIEGTFSGSAKDPIGGGTANIAGGTFKAKLP